MSRFESVDEYIAVQPPSSQPTLHAIRAAIRAALPDADEGISYDIPTYKVRGGATGVLHFAGWKKHASLYPATERVVDACADELAAFSIDKGTIKLPFDKPVPTAMITLIATIRAQEVSEVVASRAAKKTAAKKTAAKKTAAKKTAT